MQRHAYRLRRRRRRLRLLRPRAHPPPGAPPAACGSPPSPPTAGPARPLGDRLPLPAEAARRSATGRSPRRAGRRRGGLPGHAGRGLARARPEAAGPRRAGGGPLRRLPARRRRRLPGAGTASPTPPRRCSPRPATACPSWPARGSAGARLVTNPGCYATAIALARGAAACRRGLVSAEGIAVTALSGVSGAGRKASEDYSFCEVDEDLRAYRHRQAPARPRDRADRGPLRRRAAAAISFTPGARPHPPRHPRLLRAPPPGRASAAELAARPASGLRRRALREGAARPTRWR